MEAGAFGWLPVAFLLACAVGAFLALAVTPTMRPPVLAGLGALSSVVLVGALTVGGVWDYDVSKVLGGAAILVGAAALFAGIVVTRRLFPSTKTTRM